MNLAIMLPESKSTLATVGATFNRAGEFRFAQMTVHEMTYQQTQGIPRMIDVAAEMFAPEFPSLLLVLVLLLLYVDHVGLHQLLNFDFADDVVIFDGSGHLEVM